MSETPVHRAAALVVLSLVITISATSVAGIAVAEPHAADDRPDETRIDVDAPENVTRGDDLAVDVTVISDGLEPWAVELNLQHEDSDLSFYAKEVSTTAAWERTGASVDIVVEDIDVQPGEYSIVIESAGAQQSVPLTIAEE